VKQKTTSSKRKHPHSQVHVTPVSDGTMCILM